MQCKVSETGMLLLTFIAILSACDRLSQAPDCQKLLTSKCEFMKVTGSTLEQLEADVKNICLSSCASQLHDNVAPCLQKQYPDVYNYCTSQWNTRCANVNGILCYVERLDNWIAKGIHSVDVANSHLDLIPCSGCQAQLVRNEKLFNQNSNETGMAAYTGQLTSNVTSKCGANFLDGNPDSNFQVFTPAVVPDTSSGMSAWIIIVSVLGTTLFFVLLGFLVYYKWRKSQERRNQRSSYIPTETMPRNESNSDYDDYFSAKPARLSMSTLGDTSPATRVQSGSDISSYMYSKPF